MPLLVDSTNKIFDKENVKKADLIRAKHKSWNEPRNGIVAEVKSDMLSVLHLPAIGNVTNYFTIAATEVEAGDWTVKWSTDLETINTEGDATG